jgi:hypothetical protein
MTEKEAVKVAQESATHHGWTWRGLVRASRKRRFLFFGVPIWLIRTNADCCGCNAWFEIDDSTGLIIREGFAPR